MTDKIEAALRKYYKMGNYLLDEEVLRAHRIIEIDGQFVALTASKFDAGSPENAKRAFDAIARIFGAEDLLAADADEGGDEKSAASEPDADGWIPWGGGERPVNENADVNYQTRDGRKGIRAAGLLSWSHEGAAFDIVAYRVVSEAPAAEKDGPWKPGDGETYHSLDIDGDPWCTTFYADNHCDRIRVAFGNCFRTREEAEAKRAEIFS